MGKEILAPEVETLGEVRAKDRGPLESVLVKKGLVPDQHIAEVYADYLMLPLFDSAPETADVDLEIGRLLPDKLCRDHLLGSVAIHGETLDVAFVSSDEMLIVDELQLLVGRLPDPAADRSAIAGFRTDRTALQRAQRAAGVRCRRAGPFSAGKRGIRRRDA